MARTVILLSGGLDSATVAAMARSAGHDLIALSFDYGQRHANELRAARAVAADLGITRHVIQSLDLRCFGGSALTADIAVPKDRISPEQRQDIPVTYVPARNTVFLALALACAEATASSEIHIGVNAVDYSGYPDCRPAFISAFQELATLATRAGVEGRAIRIHAPLLQMTKVDIIRAGIELGVDYALTTSCYDPIDEAACGRCDSCHLRRRGFQDAGVADPTRYARPVPRCEGTTV